MKWHGAIFASLVALVALFLSGCGSSSGETPAVNPALPYINPVTGQPSVCQTISGDTPLNALRNDPILANLRAKNGTANSLAVTLSYLYYDVNKPQQNLVGSGTFDFPEIQYLVPFSMQGYSTSFCVSSTNLGSATAAPGIYQNGQLQLALRGTMTLPLPSQNSTYVPFGTSGQYQAPYTTGYGTTQEPLEVTIGTQTCGAKIYSGRFVGCIQVKVGSGYNAQTLNYQVQ